MSKSHEPCMLCIAIPEDEVSAFQRDADEFGLSFADYVRTVLCASSFNIAPTKGDFCANKLARLIFKRFSA